MTPVLKAHLGFPRRGEGTFVISVGLRRSHVAQRRGSHVPGPSDVVAPGVGACPGAGDLIGGPAVAASGGFILVAWRARSGKDAAMPDRDDDDRTARQIARGKRR